MRISDLERVPFSRFLPFAQPFLAAQPPHDPQADGFKEVKLDGVGISQQVFFLLQLHEQVLDAVFDQFGGVGKLAAVCS